MSWSAEEQAELGERLRVLVASGADLDAIVAARGPFRYRHGWKLIGGKGDTGPSGGAHRGHPDLDAYQLGSKHAVAGEAPRDPENRAYMAGHASGLRTAEARRAMEPHVGTGPALDRAVSARKFLDPEDEPEFDKLVAKGVDPEEALRHMMTGAGRAPEGKALWINGRRATPEQAAAYRGAEVASKAANAATVAQAKGTASHLEAAGAHTRAAELLRGIGAGQHAEDHERMARQHRAHANLEGKRKSMADFHRMAETASAASGPSSLPPVPKPKNPPASIEKPPSSAYAEPATPSTGKKFKPPFAASAMRARLDERRRG